MTWDQHREHARKLAARAARKADQADTTVNQVSRDRLLHEAQVDASASLALVTAYRYPEAS